MIKQLARRAAGKDDLRTGAVWQIGEHGLHVLTCLLHDGAAGQRGLCGGRAHGEGIVQHDDERGTAEAERSQRGEHRACETEREHDGNCDACDEQQQLLDLHLALPLADHLMQQVHGTPAHGDDLPLVQQVDDQRDEKGQSASQECDVEKIHRILRDK